MSTTMYFREALYNEIRAGIEYVMVRHGGTGSTGDYPVDHEAWRTADLPGLLDAVMAFLRAGLSPNLDRQAIADGVASARHVLVAELDQIAQWVQDDAAAEDEAVAEYAADVAKRIRDRGAEFWAGGVTTSA